MVLQTLFDISNIKVIPKDVVDTVMKKISIAGDALGDLGDIFLALLALLAFVLVTTFLLFLTKNFPKLQVILKNQLDQIFFGALITSFLKSYFRVALNSVSTLSFIVF